MEPQPLFEAVPEGPESMDVSVQEGSVSDGAKANNPLVGSFTWVVRNFATHPDPKIYSDKFEVGTHFWRLLIFPRGNKPEVQQVSLYLDFPEAGFTPLHLSPKAAFKLTLINHLDASRNITKEAQHTFTQSETDWGFTSFMNVSEVFNPASGFIRADGAIIIQTEITVQRDERYSYDSRRETGHVGVKNQGATCYMNSLLQYLFHIPFFRKAVYHLPTPEDEEPCRNLPLALQALFYRLQYSGTSVSTKDLTKSFGWASYEAFQQHDVQELNRVLCEKLEDKMKGTKVERVINDLFEGQLSNFIECVNVAYKSERKEAFQDISVMVKGCRDVYASFDRYCEDEMMEGANQYAAEGHGLQDAKKGVRFESFPPVLQLQLKRFDYDFMRDVMVKINDRYEFPDELDLDRGDRRYLSPTSDPSVRNLYKLHSVLVHSGGVHGGHYYAFIRPDGKTWFKFDDERVTLEDDRKAMDEQFGGEDEATGPTSGFGPPAAKFARISNAYMLVYVRTSDWERIMCPTDKEDVSEPLRKRLEAEQAAKEQRQKEKAEAHLYCTLRIATEADVRRQIDAGEQHFDLVDFEKVPAYRLPKNTPFSAFKEQIAASTGVPPELQRYWTMQRRRNHTYRPARPLNEEECGQPLMDLREHRETGSTNKAALMDLKLYLETPNNSAGTLMPLPKPPAPPSCLWFFKRYDPATERLTFLKAVVQPRASLLRNMLNGLCPLMGLPAGTDMEAYEEVKYEPEVMVERLDPGVPLTEQPPDFDHGDIFIVQTKPPPGQEAAYRFPTPQGFLAYVRARRLVTFKRLEEPREAGFTLELLKGYSYDEVEARLAAHLGLAEPSKLRLTAHNVYTHQPQKSALRHRGMPSLERMLQHGHSASDILYYETLDIPLPEFEQLKTLKVCFHNERAEFVAQHNVRVPRDGSVADVLAVLGGLLGPKEAGQPLRLLEIYNSKLWKVFDPSEALDRINTDNYWTFRGEVVPPEQRELGEGDRLATVQHIVTDKDGGAPTVHGEPFLLLLQPGDSLGQAKQRIQAKFGISGEEFAKWRFAWVGRNGAEPLTADSEPLYERMAVRQQLSHDAPYLGIENDDKPKRVHQHRYTTFDKPVKINC